MASWNVIVLGLWSLAIHWRHIELVLYLSSSVLFAKDLMLGYMVPVIVAIQSGLSLWPSR